MDIGNHEQWLSPEDGTTEDLHILCFYISVMFNFYKQVLLLYSEDQQVQIFKKKICKDLYK